jgi:hypothetical protein
MRWVTVEVVQIVASNLWDVDVDSETINEWLAEIRCFVARSYSDWAAIRLYRARKAKRTGIDERTDDDDCFDAGRGIEQFLRSKLGKPAYFDAEDKFVESEYVRRKGRVYQQSIDA